MTRFLVFFTLVAFLSAGTGIVLAQGESAAGYERASELLQEAMTARLEAQKVALEAKLKYEMALAELENFKAMNPDWNPELVSQRIAEVRQVLVKLKGDDEAAPHAPAAAAPHAAPAAVAPDAPADVSAPFIGHGTSKKLHASSCQWAQQMSPRNRVYFQNYADAVAAGYTPCKVCKPDQGAAFRSAAPAAPVSQVAPPAAAPGAEESEYWASSKGKTFHRPGCEWAKKISAANLVKHQSRAEAVGAGLNPCKVCNP